MSVSLLVLNTSSTVSYMNDFRHSVYHYDMCQNNKSNDSSRSHVVHSVSLTTAIHTGCPLGELDTSTTVRRILGELNSSSTELPVPAGHIRALRERITVLDSTTYLHTHGKVPRMHGTCSNRSMLITTCITLKAHLQTLYKIQLQANLLQTASRLSGRETGETSACISCSPLDVGLKFTFLQKKKYLFQSIHMQVKYLIIAYML